MEAFINISIYIFSDNEITQRIIDLRESRCGGFKELKDFLPLPGLTNLDWRKWEEEGLIVNFRDTQSTK